MLWILFYLLIFATVEVAADHGYDNPDLSRTLSGKLWYLEDPDNRWNFDTIRTSPNLPWQSHNSAEILAFGYTFSGYWVHFNLQNNTPERHDLILEIGYPLLDTVNVYAIAHDGTITQWHTGDLLPFAERPIKHHNFLFPLVLPASAANEQNELEVYIYIKSTSALQVPLSIWYDTEYWLENAYEIQLHGAYYGLMVALLLYNVFLFYSIRDRVYGFYVVYVSALVVLQFTLYGGAYRYLWPEQPWLNHYAPILTLWIAIVFGVFFLLDLLQLKAHSLYWYRWFKGLAYLSMGCGPIALLIPYQYAMLILIILIITVSSTSLVGGITLLKHDYRPARYFILACSSFLIGAIIFGLNKFGILPHTFITEYSIQFGAALEVLLLSFALAARINLMQEDNDSAERGRLEAEALAAAKGRFLAIMSHEIRTPLNGVLGMLELLLRTPLDKQQKYYAKTASISGQSLLGIINDILDFTKIESGKLKLEQVEFNLAEQLSSLVAIHAEKAHGKGIELMLDVPPEQHCWLQGDSLRLQQVVGNLLSNAIKFTDQGEVVLKARISPTSKGRVDIAISVVDSGIGISKQASKKIFETFSQAEDSTTRIYGGSGLGLNICRQLVELMDGQIGVISELGHGSTFWLKIPLSQVTAPPGSKLSNQSVAELGLEQVLLISDNTRQQAIASGYFKQLGMNCTIANKADFLSEQSHIYSLLVFDADIQSFDAAQYLSSIYDSSHWRNIPCVILSSMRDISEQEPMVAEKRRAGYCLGLLAKPFSATELANCLLSLMQSQKHHKQIAATKKGTSSYSGRILLVEDTPINVEIILAMLKIMGLEADVAENGQKAVDLYQQHDYRLILMDCQLPILDGFNATRCIREIEQNQEHSRHIPIVALTASTLVEEQQKCYDSGMDAYLEKPITLDKLRSQLKVYFDVIEEPRAWSQVSS